MRRLVVAILLLAAVGGIVFVAVDRSKPDWYQRLRYPLEYEQLVRRAASAYDIDPALIAAVIYAESRFEPGVVSEAGAIGLMQLLPETGRWIATSTGGTRFAVRDLYNPRINVRLGSWYLRELLERYRGDLSFALAAYHAGQTNADRWLASGGGIRFGETRAYVESVLAARDVYRDTYATELGL